MEHMNNETRREIEELVRCQVEEALRLERLRMEAEKERERALAREQRKQYSRLGFCLFAFFAITVLVQFGMSGALYLAAPALVDAWMDTAWFPLLLSAVPMYLVAFPVTMALLRLLKPVPASGGERFGTQEIILLSVLAMGIGFGVSRIGAGVEFFLQIEGVGEVTDQDFTSFAMLLNIIVAVFLAPAAEELLFRKYFIDRVGGYGEQTAVLLSGLLFGLAHGNFQQFCYTFALGMVWAYVYVRTGNLGYTIAFHMLFNFFGVMVSGGIYRSLMEIADPLSAVWRFKLMTGIDLGALGQWAGTLASLLYLKLEFVCSMGGIVLLLMKRKQIHFRQGDREIPEGRRFSTALLNPGMIAFLAFSLWMFSLNT